jgi:hypothetical protein
MVVATRENRSVVFIENLIKVEAAEVAESLWGIVGRSHGWRKCTWWS